MGQGNNGISRWADNRPSLSPGGTHKGWQVTELLACGGGMVGRTDREDVDRMQPAAGVAYLMAGELAADIGVRVTPGGGGGRQSAVEIAGALVERGPVRSAQSDAAIGLGQVVQVRVAEHDDL